MADYRQGEAANGVVLRIWRGKTTIFYECGKLCRASLGGGLRFAVGHSTAIEIGYEYYFLEDDASVEFAADRFSADFVLHF